eukprot:s2094_g3.t1
MSHADAAYYDGRRLRRADTSSFEEVRRCGHFRRTTVRQLFMGCGMIFNDGLRTLMAAGGNASCRYPTREQVQLAGETLFGASCETDHVDVFVGHSWSAGRWQKFLALCLYFNLQIALWCSIGTWIVTVLLLLGLGGLTYLGGSYLALPCLVYLPIAVFFLALLFGQQLLDGVCGFGSPSIWVDKLCVHQTDLELKAAQIAALPIFVAHSSRMLILWDDTYFERLWCNLELATFAQYRGAEKVDVMPLWLAPWLLCSILLDLLSASLFELLEHVFPNWSAAWMLEIMGILERVLGKNPAMLKFAAWFVIWMMSSIVYLPASIPSFFSFRMKFQSHRLMLDQMANFDVRAAQCTLPLDRAAIEQQVQELFQQSDMAQSKSRMQSLVDDGEVCFQRLHPLTGVGLDSLDRFNSYIRGTLREFVIGQIGHEVYVPWRVCLIAFLPMIFYSSVNILGCDNGPCEESARLAGYSSVAQYMAVQTVGWSLCIVTAFPLTYPILLRMVKCVLSHGEGPAQLMVAFFCCPLAYLYSYICGSFIWAGLVSLVENYSTIQVGVFIFIMALLALQMNLLFSISGKDDHQTSTSCLCIRRQEGSYDVLPHPC